MAAPTWRRLGPCSYGEALHEHGRLVEAETAFREALEGFRQLYGADAFYTLHVQRLLADVLRDREDYAAAAALLLEAFAGLREERGIEDSFTQGTVESLVALYERWGRPDEAARYRALVVPEEQRTARSYH